METRDTLPDTSKEEPQRPDRAKHDELGRTAARPARSSPREQPAKAVHQKRDDHTDGAEPAEVPTRPTDEDQDVGKGAVED